MLPPFEIVHRLRPVTLVAWERTSGFVAPYAAVELELGTHDLAGRLVAGFRGPDGLRLEGWYDGGRRLAGVDVTDATGRTTHHRSRRHGRPDTPPEAVAATLTGRQLTVLTRNDGTWTARGRVDLTDRVVTADPRVLAGLEADVAWLPRSPGDRSPVTSWRAGTFGQLGVRDVGLVTEADGTPVERDGLLFLTMTHAGPGFFDTAHTGVWSLDPRTLAVEHRGALYLRRDGRVLGDHAVHLVRDGDRWMLAISTWGDFDRTSVAVTLATSTDDLLAGEHVLDAVPLDLPTDVLPGRVVGTWDPHLVRVEGHWHLAFVAARKFFDFYPALARAAEPGRLDGWERLGAATDRRSTEAPQLRRLDGGWRVLASDGAGNPRGLRRRFPVFDLTMTEVGALEAPYPTNIPWPTLLERDGVWTMLTFDGTPYGGGVSGYGTHGDLVVLRTKRADGASDMAGHRQTGDRP
ncbi:MAG: hypothetical protein ABWX84_15955 [Nocardioides sp.]